MHGGHFRIGLVRTAVTGPQAVRLKQPRRDLQTRRPLWLWPNLLSLDAPAIAVLWQVLLARGLAAHTNRGEPVVLALAVWLIYIADRALDALRPSTAAWEPERKTFYRHHLRAASTGAIALALLIVPLAYLLLRRSAFYTGLVLAIPLLCYLITIHLLPLRWRAKWPRELAVAALFTSGTFAAIWAGNALRQHRLFAPTVIFSLLCWVNCAVIKSWEWQEGQSGLEQGPGNSTMWIARYLFSVGLTISGLALSTGYLSLAPEGFSAAAFLSGIAFAALAFWRPRVSIDAVRVAADLALCTPLLIFLFPSLK